MTLVDVMGRLLQMSGYDKKTLKKKNQRDIFTKETPERFGLFPH
jgi:hypothetical protein